MATFIRRVISVLGLDPAVFEEVEADRSATRQAMLVVVLASIGAGVGNAGIGQAAPRAIVLGTVASLVAWATWAILVYYLGTRIMPGPATEANVGQLLRTLGFAAAPGMFRAFEVFGNARWLVFPLTSVWMLVAMTIAVRQALDYATTARAVGVALLAWVVSLTVAAGIGLLFSVPVW